MSDAPILPDDEPVSQPSVRTMRGGETNSLGRIDHYELLRKLGGGGFGVVYLARDTVGGVEVALKTLHPLLKRNAEEMDLLREKFKLASRLAHPNIATALVLHRVGAIDVWDDEARRELKLSPGDSVMVMRYAPGVTLSKWRRRFPEGIVPFDRAVEIGRQIAAALDYAHGERIVHRDVKPGNIMVETLGGASRPGEPQSRGATARRDASPHQIRVRILDFGLAAEIRSSMSRVSTEAGDTSGTRPYMAPEQWLGRKQDGRTDQYALACVLYELLSGAPPFAGVFETGDPAVMKDAALRDAPDPVPGLPRGANAALLRALAKDPAARFPSCRAFVNEVGRAVPASHGGSAGTPRPTRRRLALAAAAVLAVGALGALLLPPTRGGEEVESHAESAELVSYAETAESAETGGEAGLLAAGAAGRSEAGGVPRAEPDGAVRPAEPPEGASPEELQAARGRLADALDARRAEGWPDDSEESASLLAAISGLDGRVEAALAAQERAQRAEEAAARSRRTAEARAEADISRLKAAGARDARDVQKYRKWNDGEFRTQFEALDGRRKELDGCSKAADLDRAKAASADVRAAAVWIADNAAAREEIDGLEKAAAEAARACAEAEAGRYAKAALYRAETARNDAVRRRDRSDWAGAKEKFGQAGTLYGEALSAAKVARAAAKAADAVADAEAAKARGDWSGVLAAAERALEWEAGNEGAKALKAEAEKGLRPVWAVSATLPGGAAATGAKLALGGKTHTLPVRLNLTDGKSYGPGEVTLERDGRTYVGTLERTTAGWKGERKAVVALLEKTKPNPGDSARIDLGSGVSLEMVNCSGVAPDFWMGKFEVTQEQWERVMGTRPSYFKNKPTNPVENVSWNDCQEFVAKLNALPAAKASGLAFRLPTEEEWETACRAGAPKSKDYCKLADGTQITKSNLSRVAWFGKGWDDGPTEVGKNRAPNAWGLYDMHGNVWEWTQTAVGGGRVCRGGGFSDSAVSCAAGDRSGCTPDGRNRDLGFRLAASGRTAAAPANPEAAARTSDGKQAARSAAASRSAAVRPAMRAPGQARKPGVVKTVNLGGGTWLFGGDVKLDMVHCLGVAPDFWMGKFEVTQEQWELVMGTTPSYFKNKPKNPVEAVSWNDCQEFVAKLNALPAAKASGLAFRLPTEEEWETACRAGAPKSEDYCKLADGTQMTWSNLARVAWFDKSWDDGPTEVGKNREPNAWGLYDMHGNVWEWTQTADGGNRVSRGGCFGHSADYCTAGYRAGCAPDIRNGSRGFRLAASGRTAAK